MYIYTNIYIYIYIYIRYINVNTKTNLHQNLVLQVTEATAFFPRLFCFETNFDK